MEPQGESLRCDSSCRVCQADLATAGESYSVGQGGV